MTATLDALVAIWLAAAALGTIAVWHYARTVHGDTMMPGFAPTAAVIIPVRGADNLPRLLAALRAQNFPDWRVIFAVEAESDPAYPVLRQFVAETGGGPRAELVVAGIATDGGQKIHNQLAALARLTPRDEIVAFADADIVPRPDWLTRLVSPLARDDVQVVSGWRWLTPADNRLATAFVCAAHASFSLAPRQRFWALAWGGSMALRQSYLDKIDLRGMWRGAVLDDLRLTRAAWTHGGTVLGPSALLLRTPVDYTWHDGAAFIRRQYIFIRIHTPRYWALAAAAVTIPPLGWAAGTAAIVAGQTWLVLAFATVIALHQYRATMRRRVAQRLWNDPSNPRQSLVERFAVPAWLLFHAVLLWSTALSRTIRWGARVYRLDTDGKLLKVDSMT